MGVTKFGYHLLSREYSRPPNLAISSWRGLPTLPAQRVADASHMLRSDVLRSVRANQPRALRARVVSACVHPPPLLSTTSPVGATASLGRPASSTSNATRPPRSSAAGASTRPSAPLRQHRLTGGDHGVLWQSGLLHQHRHETAAFKRSLGEHAYRIPVSSIKSMVGHSLGGIGSIEVAACALSLVLDVVPPTANLHEQGPDCDLDYVPIVARDARLDTVLTVGSGFGGFQTAVVLSGATP